FNGDGQLDLGIAGVGSNTIAILLGRGDGTFDPAADYSTGANPFAIVIGDFDGDGILDLAVANRNDGAQGTVSVLLGNGDRTFQPAANFPVVAPRAIVAGDFNGDGQLDLAIANFNGLSSNTVSILLGNGDGTFRHAASYSIAGGPSSI